MDMQEDNMLDVIRRYLSGECTPEEKVAVERWVAEDPDHREYFEAIKKVWKVIPRHDMDVDFEHEWQRISTRLGIDPEEEKEEHVDARLPNNSTQTPHISPFKQLLRVAAVILIIALPAYYFASFDNNSEVTPTQVEMAMQKFETPRGESASMELSDGSKITLNSMSSVRFPKEFKEDRREIYLEGEAFFTVSHNENVPFVVHSNGVEVKVLGTEFNVDAYKEDEAVEVVVRDGKVSVKQNKPASQEDKTQFADNTEKPANEVILTKGQRTLVKAGEFPTTPENVGLRPYLAWVNGEMVFEGTPMSDVITRLGRVYDLNFQVQDSTLLSKRLKASFKRETPKKVLGIIAFSLGINYEMHGDTVIFKSKNKRNTQ